MDRILIILKKENGPRASSALGLNTIIFKHVYLYKQQTQVSVYRTIGPLVFSFLFSFQLKNGIRGEKVTGADVKTISNDTTAQKLLLYLEYRISEDLIDAPVELPPIIDEVYWTVFALWGTQ